MEIIHNSSLQTAISEIEPITEAPLWLTTLLCAVTSIIVLYIEFNTTKESSIPDNSGDEILGLEHIKGPKPMFPKKIIGNLLDLMPFTRTFDMVTEWLRDYPGLMKYYGGNQVIVGLHTPELIQQLFKSTDLGHGPKAPLAYSAMKPFIHTGVLVSTGKFWQAQRKTLMKSQKLTNIKACVSMLNKHSYNFAKDLEKVFEDGKPRQINHLIVIMFLKVISEMITGNEVQAVHEYHQYYHSFELWKQSITTRMLHPWLQLDFIWKWHSTYNKIQQAIQEMTNFANRRIEEHQKTRRDEQTDNQTENENGKFRSVLDELVDAGVSHNQMVQEVNTMIFGGHETGATATRFFILSMALNPEIQRICQQEVDGIFENPEHVIDGQLTFDAVNTGLKYMERCLHETMRLYPPVFSFFRKIDAPLIVEFEGNKYLLPAGTSLACAVFNLHRNPKYFANPEVFDPDRFLPENVGKRHPCAYIPFSGGPRGCLGIRFAMVEMKIVAAYLLRYFDISCLDQADDIKLLPFTTLTPERDYMFHFKKRREILK